MTGEYEDDVTMQRLRGPLSESNPQVLRVLKDKFLDPPSTLPYNLSKDKMYQKQKVGNSWWYIYHYLEQVCTQRNGFFVEAGALDGEYLSNTLWLEEKLGWTGLLVEPGKENYLEMLSKNRRAWTSNTCLSDTTYPKETVQVSIKLNRQYVGKKWDYRGSSYLLGKELRSKNYDNFFKMADESYSPAQCFPLGSYLRALNVSTVDLLSIDIQGAEKEVLWNFSWDVFRVKVIVVEVIEDVKDFDFVEFIESKGYVMINKNEFTSVEDQIYVRKDALPSKRIVLYGEEHS